MSCEALILTYHSIGGPDPPLSLDPGTFRAHLDCLVEEGAVSLTVSELAEALRSGTTPERAIAITFDDGYADVHSVAAPLLHERGLKATVFCVADYLGRTSDWPTMPSRADGRRLAGPEELAELAAGGFEIGSHGSEHAPLAGASANGLRRELADSRRTLEREVGVPVDSFAYAYGQLPDPSVRTIVEQEYRAACAGGQRRARQGDDPLALPRVDAHYLRRPALLRRALRGSAGAYLTLRRAGARVRRLAIRDYARPAASRRRWALRSRR